MTAFAARALDTMGVAAARDDARTVVVVGNGMVGHRFCERLATHDRGRRLRIVCFGEERRAAYDRVHLTAYMSGKNADALVVADAAWYASCGITLHLGERVIEIDRTARTVVSSAGRRVAYDALVLATGSAPFVPAIPGVETPGVFVYRTIEDLDAIRAWSARARRAAVIGGGLLGLEAAKAVHDLSLEVHVVEFAPRLMPRQVDTAGGEVLRRKIAALGVHVHTGMQTQAILGTDAVTGLRFAAGDDLVVDMVVVSAGIRPRDELARTAGLEVGPRGGIVVDAQLRTSDPDVFCIGESALAGGMIYGLVGPGYEMAEVAARRLCGDEDASFAGADLSTKLKLMGVDVASFGDAFADEAAGGAKACTKAGTGCGGCVPLVAELLEAGLAAAGREVNRNLCEHFAFTRQELFEIVKLGRVQSFHALLASHGTGSGCEVCRPAVASILASTWNDFVLNHATIQDTNDRFLANIQRGGTYSVVPRIPGGEITPEK